MSLLKNLDGHHQAGIPHFCLVSHESRDVGFLVLGKATLDREPIEMAFVHEQLAFSVSPFSPPRRFSRLRKLTLVCAWQRVTGW